MKRVLGWLALLTLCTQAIVVGQAIIGPDQMNQCDQATFTVTITNASANQDACNLIVTHTLPNDGFLYVPASTTITLNETSETFTNDPEDDTWDINAIRGSDYVLPHGESITISYDMETTCVAVSGTDIITADFEDCDDPGVPLQNISSTSVEILPGAIVLTKTPSIQDASVGDLVTWTITVENTGLGTVSNVEISDVLGSGLAYVSDSGSGANTGQTTTWDPGTTPALSSIDVGASISIDLIAEVVACEGLVNDVDASFGCGPGDSCYDTLDDEGTATASLNLLVDNPALSFTPPNVTVGYCTDETAGLIEIINSGLGTARNVRLCCDIAYLAVDPSRLPPGSSYADNCFSVPDIAAGETFDLAFYLLHQDVDWCAGGPSGSNVFELTYTNDCNIPFIAYPQFSTLSSSSGPSLAVTKTGPDSLRLGEIGDYDMSVEYVGSVDCGGGSPGPVTIVDTYPEGFVVANPAGGTVDADTRTIAWVYDPTIDPPFEETIQLQAPTDCGYCANPGGGTENNSVTATGTDCCGCSIIGTASAATTILCEGYGDDVDLFSSTMELSTNTVLRCSSIYDAIVTHTYVFEDDLALDDLLLSEITYFMDGNGDFVYETDTAAVTGATLGTTLDGTPSGRLELALSDSTSVRGKTIVFTYHVSVLGLNDPSCQASSYPINAGIELDPGASSVGYCGTMYADPDQRLSVTAQPPAMSVSIDGVPVVQETCATYDVTITLNRASTFAKPYDARIVLSNNGGSILDISQAVCGGTVNPTDGTTCTSPVIDATTYEWRFADLFDSDADVATITFPVTVPCGGELASLSVTAYYDDLCHDDAIYDDSCSTSSSDEASLSLSADVYTRKSPEILYATTRDVSWSLVVHNTGNGTAYNVWIDDVLGSGLEFDEANTVPSGATISANLDHEGNPINGASFLFDELAPGELKTITFAADLVACSGLTNSIAASWGCNDTSCQTPREDSSSVVIPTGKLVATSFSPTPVPMCSSNLATVTVKNAGVTTLYNIAANVTLPAGLIYLGNPEFSVDNGASWSSAGEPAIAGQLLAWTSAQIATLVDMAPKDIIKIRFDYTVGCIFRGGQLSFQAAYENPCATPKLSNVGIFTIGLTPASVLVAVRQVSPSPGEAIDCGGEATWEIDVTNDGAIGIPVAQVTATLGAGLTFAGTLGVPERSPNPVDNGAINGQNVTWEIKNLLVDETVTLSLTATEYNCDALDVFVNASWGCGAVDGNSATDDAACTTTSPTTASISANREPPLDLSASLSPSEIGGCVDTSAMTLTIENTGTVASVANTSVTIELPDGLSYRLGTTSATWGEEGSSEADPGGALGPSLTWDLGATLGPGETLTLLFDVDVSCYFTTQSIPIDVSFYDCCGGTPYSASTTATLAALTPTLTITKMADVADVTCGDIVTWTIEVRNIGNAIAEVVRIEDFLGENLSFVSATGGAVTLSGGEIVYPTPPAHGTAYGWELGPLAVDASASVTIAAQLVAPPDCTNALRTNTAVVTWACGSPDGNPATADYDCGSGVWDSASDRVLLPNLAILPADITPRFTCAGDGVTPSSGTIELTVRNPGDGAVPVGADFDISLNVTLPDLTTNYAVSGGFVSLGGTLPLAASESQTLTFESWDVGCDNCTYTITATLDSASEICECSESDNTATLPTTITLPDLVVDSANLAVTCIGDGQIRIQGPVTLRNDGCGEDLAGDVSVRFRLFDRAGCTGSEVDTFTVDFTDLSIASSGGTDQQTIDVTRTLDTCGTCEISIRIEADEDGAVCECNGTNNDLCSESFAVAFPDLTITDIDFSQLSCAADSVFGFVRITVENAGCGASGSFDLRLETDGCLSFTDKTVVSLAAGASATIDFAITGLWADCSDCSCAFTATVDPDGEICECDGTNNTLSEAFSSTQPDLEISGAVASIGCAVDGNATVSANVTLENAGCSSVSADFDIHVTLYDGANCTGNVVDTWIETISGETITASGSTVITLSEHTLTQALCAGDCDYSAQFEVDANNNICECDGTDNLFCLSSITSEIPNLVVTNVDPEVDCRTGSAEVTATVGNTGCGDASGIIFRLTSPACGLTINSVPVDLAAGASQDIVFAYTPNCSNWNCTYTVTADPDAATCECDGGNALIFNSYLGIGSIGDRVWFDSDGDGEQDAGEDGIPGVTVTIEGDLDGDGSIDYTAEVATEANGEYLFENLPTGDYTLTVDAATLPDGLDQTYDYDGPGPSPHSSNYTLAENEHNREQDFGYRGNGSIGDYVWFDINGDGVQDPSESGIENVTVTLHGDVDGDGINEILTTTTDANGLYLFDYLPAGPYTITVDDTTLPDGLSQTYDYDGLGSLHTSDYSLGDGEHNREQDFGYAAPALSVDKVITDIRRGGSSIGNITGPVEPGDVIVYQFTIENVGPVPAYEVGFDDTLPLGVVSEIGELEGAGSYAVSGPSASGSLNLSGSEAAFTKMIGATVNAGETLTATFAAVVTSSVQQGVDLTNTAHAFGEAEDGTSIPPRNDLFGDISDSDVEDPEANDTGIVTVAVLQPALSVNKTITNIVRPSVGSLGVGEPVEPGDVVFYQFVITNVGGARAYGVEFTDILPTGMVTEIDAPGDVGSYSVSSPSASGSLGLTDGASAFTTSMDATIGGGESLTADFTALITSAIVQGVNLVNTAEATGYDGFGTEIPNENTNPDIDDTSDDDPDDLDADDTGTATIAAEEPALSVNKIITDIVRRGSSIGDAGPVEPGDVLIYQYTIRNVGLGTAYAVNFTDALPTGLVTETDAPGILGTYDVSSPSVTDAPLLGLADGVSTFTTSIGATIVGGGQLVAEYSVFVTSDVRHGVGLTNVAAAVGIDGAGNPIPAENADIGDTSDDDEEDDDADDTGITEVTPVVPALDVNKQVVDVIRGGTSIGVVDPVLFGDVIVYEYTIRNVGLGTAYAVEFTDTLPAGLETETGSLIGPGSYTIDGPAASGSLAVPDGVGSFTTSIGAEISGGGTLAAAYAALVRTDAPPAVDLVNIAEATGEDGAGTEISDSNGDVGDVSDVDREDPDADDTGIASVRVGSPALVTRKAVVTIDRQGTLLTDSVVQPGDIVTYEIGVTNVGSGPAQNVTVVDVLPLGFVYEGNPSAVWPSGSSTIGPAGLTSLTLMWTLNADLAAGEELVVTFDARVTSDIEQTGTYTNTVTATGEDAADQPIPPDARDVVPEDDDPDDTSAVSLTGAMPALVTEKTILNIVRSGRSLGSGSTVQALDVVTYQLQVANVGLGIAYEVDVRDTLPSPFAYISDTTQGSWPYRIGTFRRNPTGAPGSTLLWDTDATLDTGETLTLTFDALVDGPVIPGDTYTNVLQATGIDGAGTPIPANRSTDVPGDTDPDDRDDVSLTGIADVPALITSKRVTDIIRAGDSIIDHRIEEGDIVEYELTVQNVGAATVYNVTVTDQLPVEFAYIDATTSASWPVGSSFADPSTGFGDLQWSLNATLRPGDRLVLRFLSFVVGPIYDGSAYMNIMRATGLGADGTPVPTDQQSAVPGDIDPDDASQTMLVGRSAYIQGEGGSLVPVPILRKTAEVVSARTCEAWSASVDRLWFQTDIAMYAASEFELLRLIPDAATLISGTLLPTWMRTVRFEVGEYACDNLLQVNVLSSVGIPLSHGPLLQEAAERDGISSVQALEERLSKLAVRSGVSQDTLPPPTQWIFLEYEGGEPIYETVNDALLGPSGTWTIMDDDIVASALGMGLLKQSMEAETLLSSSDPVDRCVGWVLVEALSNKIIALESDLTLRTDGAIAYVPHSTQWDTITDVYTVTDSASTLFDQLSLVWGLSQAISLFDSVPTAWPADEAVLRNRVRDTAVKALHEALLAIATLHLTPHQEWISSIMPGTATADPAATLDLGLLLVSLEAAQGKVDTADSARLENLRLLAMDALAERQDETGWFSDLGSSSGGTTWALLPQLAGIRGLLTGSDLIPHALELAQAAFDALDEALWTSSIGTGLYANFGSLEWQSYCYTPLEIGLAAGALRELALQSTEDRSAHILRRMSGFIRTIVDDAALQLSNASPAQSAFSRGSGRGTLSSIQTDLATGLLAPVLQQRLCLDDEISENPCGGWTVETQDPWYQTDIAMFAAFVVQDRLPMIEDYADANLAAVTLHSGLGIPFDSIPSLQSAVERYVVETKAPSVVQALDPIAVAYAAGSPEIGPDSLSWNPASFDKRILPSAQGMTLLREAQEARQLLAQVAKEPHEQLQERLLLSSILQKLLVLSQMQIVGPGNVSYIPHAVAWNGSTPASWDIRDRGSTAFDQLSLLFGLSEAFALLTDARIQQLIASQPFPETDWGTLIRRLTDDVLRTLEIAHLDPINQVLTDRSDPALSGWIRTDAVSLVNLGLLASSFDHVLATFGELSSIGTRVLSLLQIEVSFLQEALVDARGGFAEAWPSADDAQPGCDQQTLVGQAAALRTLQVAQQWLGLDADAARRAFGTLDARFWDDSLFLYRTQRVPFEWCVSPLDLALTIDALSRMADQLSGKDRSQLTIRLRSHVDRVVDGVPLQLSGSLTIHQDSSIPEDRLFAPVFDAQACFRSSIWTQGAGWAQPGDTIRYTVSAENITEETFYALVLEDALPDGVTAIATDPVGEQNDPLIQWQFDELLPSEERSWQILARVDDDVALGNVLQNCATLTYTDAAGEQQPAREACADKTIQSPEDRLSNVLDAVKAVYRTDEAMHLAASLEALACHSTLDWQDASVAHELADENLGTLLGESRLGIPLYSAPHFAGDENPVRSLENVLSDFALAAGLPATPASEALIFLPYESGVPIIGNELGFAAGSAVITPASLGWTLAREAQYATSCARSNDPLNRYLVDVVRFTLDNQLTWISTSTIPSESGSFYLPHATIRETGAGNDTSYGISDGQSTVYGQASLLIGLLEAAQPDVLPSRGQRLAEQLATETFEQLVRHWSSADQMFIESLGIDVRPSSARWYDQGIAAQALSRSRDTLPRERGTTDAILVALAEHALAQGVEPQAIEEAARLLTLVLAGKDLNEPRYHTAALKGLDSLLARTFEGPADGYIFSPQAIRGWGHTPGQLAIVFDLLGALASYPNEQAEILSVAHTLLLSNVLEDRVQLVSPTETWMTHTQTRCSGFASVFGEHQTILPPWFDLLP